VQCGRHTGVKGRLKSSIYKQSNKYLILTNDQKNSQCINCWWMQMTELF